MAFVGVSSMSVISEQEIHLSLKRSFLLSKEDSTKLSIAGLLTSDANDMVRIRSFQAHSFGKLSVFNVYSVTSHNNVVLSLCIFFFSLMLIRSSSHSFFFLFIFRTIVLIFALDFIYYAIPTMREGAYNRNG